MEKKLLIRHVFKSHKGGDTIGFGDFLRGSLYLHYLSRKLSFNLIINIKSHPVNNYIESNDNVDISEDIIFYTHSNDKKLHEIIISKIKEQKITDSQIEINLMTNIFPTFDLINDDDYIWFRNTFVPNKFLLSKINNYLTDNNLKPNEFDILHIRCGDIFIRGNIKIEDLNIFNKLNQTINNILNLNKKCILISDYENLGIILNNHYKRNFIITNVKPVHTGVTNENNLFGTLFELFILKYANNIYNLSIYGWPSSFSYWISKAYKINYKYFQLKLFAQDVINYMMIKLVNTSNNYDQNNKLLIENINNEIIKLFDYEVLNNSKYLHLFRDI